MDDAVLRALGADLERDDPRLAALLSGELPRRSRRRMWFLLALPLLGGLFLLPLTTAVGVLALLLVAASPLAVLLAGPDPVPGPLPGHGPAPGSGPGPSGGMAPGPA